MTITSAAAIKDFARKYVAAYIAGDDAAANKWLIEWAVTKRVWFANADHLLSSAGFHYEVCADA